MSVTFIKRVLRDGIVDTRNYRYVVVECRDYNGQWREIRRCPIAALDTTGAIDIWVTVVRI